MQRGGRGTRKRSKKENAPELIARKIIEKPTGGRRVKGKNDFQGGNQQREKRNGTGNSQSYRKIQ